MSILQCLKSTTSKGFICSDSRQGHMAAFSDADLAGCHSDNGSNTRYFISIGGNRASWKGGKHYL